MRSDVELGAVRDEHLPILYAHQADPESCRMAAVKPRTREAFFALLARIEADPAAIQRVVLVGGEVVGSIGSWVADGERHLGYSIDRAQWGKGYASAAVAALLEVVTARPIHASVAAHNVASRRVLEKNGFVVVGQHRSPPDERSDAWVDELLLRIG